MSARSARIAVTLVLGAAAGAIFERLLAPPPWVLMLGNGSYRLLLAANPEMHTDRAGAFFAAAIGGASEMANLVERHGGAAQRVASAHSLRVLLVVAVLPFALQWFDVHGHWPSAAAARDVRPATLALMAAASAAAGALATIGASALFGRALALLLTGRPFRWEMARLARLAAAVHTTGTVAADSAQAQAPNRRS